MRYRGFNIHTNSSDMGVTRINPITDKLELNGGVFCTVYDDSDASAPKRIAEFEFADGYEFNHSVNGSLECAIRDYMDVHLREFESKKNSKSLMHKDVIAEKLVFRLAENLPDDKLYTLLSKELGMTDEDIRNSGCKYLASYFNRDDYAKTIATFIINEGQNGTASGSWHDSFAELDGMYGVNLSDDTELRHMVITELRKNTDTVAQVDVSADGIDTVFYTDYCPLTESDEYCEQQM